MTNRCLPPGDPLAEPDLQGQLQAELDPEFEIVRLLGEGSVAQVYLARERALQRLVAVKFMKSPYAQDDTARKRFEREARSAAKIHHHNVATVHRVGSLEDQTPFIIMEYIEGRNLADELQAEGVMTTEQACHTLSQVASALVAAHEKGIVHRDVKPANVVREKDSDRVVLTDFGIAGILETGTETITRLTKYGELLGDPRYMSPEQLLGESVTDQSDVYSLGILGYELLTLKAPYEGKTSVQMVAAHLKKEPIPLTELRPDADPFLAELLERCLSKNPLHRPRASEVAKVLEQVTEEPQASGQGRESDSFTSQSFSGAFQHIPALERFVAELKRRHVFNVAVFYILVTAGLLSFADTTLESLFDDPDNARDILVAVTLGGFPVILVLSWMFDISSKGIHRTQSEILGSARIKLYVLQALGLILSLGLAGLVGWWILSSWHHRSRPRRGWSPRRGLAAAPIPALSRTPGTRARPRAWPTPAVDPEAPLRCRALSGARMVAVKYHPPTSRQNPLAPSRTRARGEFMSAHPGCEGGYRSSRVLL